MTALLLTIWLWDACPVNPADTYRVEGVWMRPIAYLPALDDDGNVVSMPIYSAWVPVLVQQGTALSAEVACEPAAGEACVAIVTSLDEAGNEDLGGECE